MAINSTRPSSKAKVHRKFRLTNFLPAFTEVPGNQPRQRSLHYWHYKQLPQHIKSSLNTSCFTDLIQHRDTLLFPNIHVWPHKTLGSSPLAWWFPHASCQNVRKSASTSRQPGDGMPASWEVCTQCLTWLLAAGQGLRAKVFEWHPQHFSHQQFAQGWLQWSRGYKGLLPTRLRPN